MLATAYRRYAVAMAGMYWGQACAWDLKDGIESWKSKFPIIDKLDVWSPASLAPNGQKLIVQEITLIIITSTAVIDIYPKITTAPIVRRKLGSDKWDIIHEGIQAQKRDGECSAGYQLCPASLNGGCCPTDRVCGTISCLIATTTAAAVGGCGGKENLFACKLEDGGGCCPNNYKCQVDGCYPLPGVIPTQICGVSSYLCPASMNYGCCRLGMGCGYENCYSTDIKTLTLTEIITTTDSNSHTRTLTTTITTAVTPSIPAPPSITSDSGIVAKVSSQPVAVPKIPALQQKDASTGLTDAQLGGIIGGAVLLLLAVLVAAFIIIKRLNRAIKTSTANSRSKASGSDPSKPRPSQANVDEMSFDPLMMASPEIQFPSATSTPFEADSSPVYRGPISTQTPPHTNYPRGYNAVATSESSSNPGWNRNNSLDSTPQASQAPHQTGGYFDIQPDGQSHRSPYHSRNHSRNHSNSSDHSQGSNIIELDAGLDGDRRSSFQRAMQGVGRIMKTRQTNNPGDPRSAKKTSQQQQQGTTGPSSRLDWQLPDYAGGVPNAGAQGLPARGGLLGYIAEAGESKLTIDAAPAGVPPEQTGAGTGTDTINPIKRKLLAPTATTATTTTMTAPVPVATVPTHTHIAFAMRQEPQK